MAASSSMAMRTSDFLPRPMWPFCIDSALFRGVNRPMPAEAIAAEWRIFPRTLQHCACVARVCFSSSWTASNAASSLSSGGLIVPASPFSRNPKTTLWIAH
eukprot:9361641-Ditylum_brightwellii.AAC.1